MELIKMLSTNDSPLPKGFYDACFDLSPNDLEELSNQLKDKEQYLQKIILVYNKNLEKASYTIHVDCMLYLYTREECQAPERYISCIDDCYGDDLDLILRSLIKNDCFDKFKEYLQRHLNVLPDYWDLVVEFDRFKFFKYMISLGFEDCENVVFSVAKAGKLKYIVYLHELLQDVTLWYDVKYICSGDCLDYINSI